MSKFFILLFFLVIGGCASTNEKTLKIPALYVSSYSVSIGCNGNVGGSSESFEYNPPSDNFKIMKNSSNDVRNFFVTCDGHTKEKELSVMMTYYFDGFGQHTGIEINELKVKECKDGSSQSFQNCKKPIANTYKHDFVAVELNKPVSLQLSDDIKIDFAIKL